jgi:hypothetical protein
MATSPLIELPVELRLRVYDFVICPKPLSEPRTEYTGLLYSCKLLRRELESEILKRMTAFLFKKQRQCRKAHPSDRDDVPQDLEFNIPHDLSSLYNLRVERSSYQILFGRDDPFLGLMYMHFNTLTIVRRASPIESSRSSRDAKNTQRDMLRLSQWIGRHGYTLAAQPAARKYVYDWSDAPQNGFDKIMVNTRDALRNSSWAVVYHRDSEDLRLTRAEFMPSGTSIGKDAAEEEVNVKSGGWCTVKDGKLEYFHAF